MIEKTIFPREEVKDNWVVATKKIYGLPNASYIVQGKYPTRVITKKQYNG